MTERSKQLLRLKGVTTEEDTPEPLAEVDGELERMREVRRVAEQKQMDELNSFSVLDKTFLELMQLMIKRYERIEG